MEHLCRLQGRLNSPLTEAGRLQAQRLAKFLGGRGVTRVFCNPLGRTIDTAEIICQVLGCRPEIVDSFVEMNFGQLQGRSKDDVRFFPEFVYLRKRDKLWTPCPGGESYFDIALRVQRDIDGIVALGENSVIINHESTGRIMRAFLSALPLTEAVFLKQSNSSVVGFNFRTGTEDVFHI